MYLKREIIDSLNKLGITKYLLIGENVLNFHSSDDSYYEEWFDDIDDGWILAINFQEHVIKEFSNQNIDYYLLFYEEFNDFNWRILTPQKLFYYVNNKITKRLENT
jgi:F0F1-type ATP synthase gamma subunit